MDLADYLRATQRSHADLARQLDVDTSYVSLLARGLRHPSMGLIDRIDLATGQTVTVEDLIIRRRQNPRPWSETA